MQSDTAQISAPPAPVVGAIYKARGRFGRQVVVTHLAYNLVICEVLPHRAWEEVRNLEKFFDEFDGPAAVQA